MAIRSGTEKKRRGTLRIRLLPDIPSLNSAVKRSRAAIDVFFCPELVDGGYAALFRGEGIHREGDAMLEEIRVLSRRARAAIVAGSMVLENPRRGRTNSSLVFANGRRIHRYDKIHLFRPTGEERLFGAGNGAGVFQLPWRGGTIASAVILCYDLRFPLLTRLLSEAGARILFVPARWPAVRDRAWRSLLRARAIENQIFVIGCNGPGKEGGFSYAVDPFGAEIYSSRPGRGNGVVACDLSLLGKAREHHDNLREAVPLVLEGTRIRRAGKALKTRARGPAIGRDR